MKSRLLFFLTALCALLAAPFCLAQNTPSATPAPIVLQLSTGETVSVSPSSGIPYQSDMTFGQLMTKYDFNLKWADLTQVKLFHVKSTDATIVDYSAIAAGHAPDFPLSPGDTILVPMKPFSFPGGSPWDLRNTVQDFFGVDWSMAVIPEEMSNIRIPKFGIPNPSGPLDVISLYNDLGEKVPSLGQWFYRGGLDAPEILMLIPDKSAAASASTPNAKALAIADVPKNQWDTISHDIEKADIASQEFAGSHEPHPSGQLLFQDDSKILVVIGPPAYIELAASVIAAYRENARVADLEAAGYKPSENPPPSPPK